MSYSEWQLLCLTEDIEQGDTLMIEHIKDKSKQLHVVYTHDSEDDLWIYCKQPGGMEFIFSSDTLEEKGKRTKQWRIIGKSFLSLRLRKD